MSSVQMNRPALLTDWWTMQVITKQTAEGLQEPFEDAYVEVPEEHVGQAVDLLGSRKGQMLDMSVNGEGLSCIKYRIPTRCEPRQAGCLGGSRNMPVKLEKPLCIQGMTIISISTYVSSSLTCDHIVGVCWACETLCSPPPKEQQSSTPTLQSMRHGVGTSKPGIKAH